MRSNPFSNKFRHNFHQNAVRLFSLVWCKYKPSVVSTIFQSIVNNWITNEKKYFATSFVIKFTTAFMSYFITLL